LHCGTHTQFCLYLSNPPTNLPSLSALPLHSSVKSLCISSSQCTPPLSSITNFFHRQTLTTSICMVLITWNSSHYFYQPTLYCHGPLCGSNPPSQAPKIMPLQWFGAYLPLSPKILQEHIVCVHLGLVQPRLVLPHFQAMYYREHELYLINFT
jgi:hypothetical protein